MFLKPDILCSSVKRIGKAANTKDRSYVERIFEGILWRSRFIVILGVIFSLLGSVLFFVIGSRDILYVINQFLTSSAVDNKQFLAIVIGAIDFYLIGIVFLILSFGIYELFISKIDEADDGDPKTHNLLEITSLDELKTKLVNSIVIVLIVSFFQRILNMTYTTPLDMLYFALSIVALAAGIYLLRKKIAISS
jgi:uncharacterized membrane protein YqhA